MKTLSPTVITLPRPNAAKHYFAPVLSAPAMLLHSGDAIHPYNRFGYSGFILSPHRPRAPKPLGMYCAHDQYRHLDDPLAHVLQIQLEALPSFHQPDP